MELDERYRNGVKPRWILGGLELNWGGNLNERTVNIGIVPENEADPEKKSGSGFKNVFGFIPGFISEKAGRLGTEMSLGLCGTSIIGLTKEKLNWSTN